MLSDACAHGAKKDIYTLKGWCAGKGPRTRLREALKAEDASIDRKRAIYTLSGYAHQHGVRAHALALGYC